MTTLVESLQALLDPLVAGGAWNRVNTAEPPVYPYIVFSRISSTANVNLNSASNLQNTRVQVDIYSRSVSELDALGVALDAAFAAWSITNVQLTSQDLYEDAVRAFRLMKDYSVWSTL